MIFVQDFKLIHNDRGRRGKKKDFVKSEEFLTTFFSNPNLLSHKLQIYIAPSSRGLETCTKIMIRYSTPSREGLCND